MIKLNFKFTAQKYIGFWLAYQKIYKTKFENVNFPGKGMNSKIAVCTPDGKNIIIKYDKIYLMMPSDFIWNDSMNLEFSSEMSETEFGIFYNSFPDSISAKKREKKFKKFKQAQIFVKKIGDLNIDERLKKPFNSNTEYGEFCSSFGGEQRGKHRVWMGGPGGGKTTFTMYQLAKLMECNPNDTFKFISAEMDETELSEYADKLPILKNLETLCLPTYASMVDENGDFEKWDYWQLIVDFLAEGHDLVLVDSLATLGEFIIPQLEITANKFVERYLALCNKHRNGVNKNNKFTTFWTIQQVTKGGDFVGSNALKHNTQSMFEIFIEEKTGRRYVKYTKNRTGCVHGISKIYFDIKNGELVIDAEQLKMDIESREIQNTISENFQKNQTDLSELLIQHESLNLDELIREDDEDDEDNDITD